MLSYWNQSNSNIYHTSSCQGSHIGSDGTERGRHRTHISHWYGQHGRNDQTYAWQTRAKAASIWFKSPRQVYKQLKQCTIFDKICSGYGKVNYYKAVCRNTQKTEAKPNHKEISAVHEVQQEETDTREQRGSRRNFDSLDVRCLNFDSVRSVI